MKFIMNNIYSDSVQYDHEEIEHLKEHVEVIYDHISDHIKNEKYTWFNKKNAEVEDITIILPKEDDENLLFCYIEWDLSADDNQNVTLRNAKPCIVMIPHYVWGDYKTWEDRFKPLHILSRSGLVEFIRPLFAEYNINCEELSTQFLENNLLSDGGVKL
jgi:hypothetical protein